MVQFSCKLDASSKLWDARAGRMNGKSDHARTVNREIDKMNVAIHASYSELVALKETVTPVEVKEAFQGIASSQTGLLELFRAHNSEYGKRVGINLAIGTMRNYNNSYRQLEHFISQKYHVLDIPVRQLDIAFIGNYDFYLRIDCRQMPNTVLQSMIHLRKMIRLAIKRGIINRDPFSGYSPERPKAKQRYLPREEFSKMKKAKFKNPSHDFIRDMFVFSCYTGLSFSDLYQLTYEQLVTTDDGATWLMVNRQKTKTPSNVPLMDVPTKIIEKYKGLASNNRVFPMLSNSTTNQYLKIIARQCGINRHLNFHMSRHTFATETTLSQGVPIETVSRMMGHKSLSTTQIYAKVTQNKVDKDTKPLEKRINGKYSLISVNQ
jgi:site-specific recombinase XerD